ncbi:unnamed protein product [Rhizophagus irregularis]|nr:unnamed protein product [Rhizophagus irregularis]
MKTAREIASMMGLKLDDIDFSVSSVNKDRQTEVLFQEIQKANAKWTTKDDFSKLDDKLREPVDVNCHVTNEEWKVNQACSSRLPPEIKKEKVVVDEKIGQKRVNKEELSRGTISSEDSEDSNESENGETILEGKKQVMGGGKSKKGSKSRQSKKKSKKGW